MHRLDVSWMPMGGHESGGEITVIKHNTHKVSPGNVLLHSGVTFISLAIYPQVYSFKAQIYIKNLL